MAGQGGSLLVFPSNSCLMFAVGIVISASFIGGSMMCWNIMRTRIKPFSPHLENNTASVVVLVLGGSKGRDIRAALAGWNFLLSKSFLTSKKTVRKCLMLSSGSATKEDVQEIQDDNKTRIIPWDTIVVDRSAVDTVTNFTTLARALRLAGVSTVVVTTDEIHMKRARRIGRIVLGSIGFQTNFPSSFSMQQQKQPQSAHGLHFVTVPSDQKLAQEKEIDESEWRRIRDVVRAYLWVWIGWEPGRWLVRWIHPDRVRNADNGVKVEEVSLLDTANTEQKVSWPRKWLRRQEQVELRLTQSIVRALESSVLNHTHSFQNI